MREPITLPSLSDTMETGRLVRWLKQPGDAVKKGDIVAEVETDKAVMDVEAFHEGYLVGPLAQTESDIPVGAVIGYLDDSSQSVQEIQSDATETAVGVTAVEEGNREVPHEERSAPLAAEQNVMAEKPAARAVPTVSAPYIAAPALIVRQGSDGVQVSPYAKGLASEMDIDLRQIRAGGDGVIHAPQVLAAALAGPEPNLTLGPAYRYEPFTAMHKAVADNMIATLGTPTFHISARLPLTQIKAMAQAQLHSLTLLLARACALCVQKHPHFNAVYTSQGLAVREQVNIGIAVDVQDGLITPVLRDAARRTVNELAEDWRILRDKIKINRLSPGDYQGATFYLSNLGVFEHVTHFDAIVPLGAAAILALGAEQQDGKAEFTLSCDHRVVFGADAARFLETLSDYLSAPETLMTEMTEKAKM
jgi:pyruvate dehydrogenase E2 component (dihydrolipoamide acetyltransferase)